MVLIKKHHRRILFLFRVCPVEMASAGTPTSPMGSGGGGGKTQFDWTSAVRPLLAATYGNFQPTDLVKLAKCIEAR